jgi:4-amino-4-deoxychorismate lyase
MREMCDEIMIVKKGLITDAYYYNFIFEKGGMWYTPASPLLKGCRRASLLDAGILHLADISVEHIHKYDRIHLINAMTEPGKIVLHPNQVIP